METTIEPRKSEAPLEKVALESYVPPAKPSLIGFSREELAARLGEIGVAPAQRKMRVQQLWHWLYFRGAKSFDEMTSVSKDIRAELAKLDGAAFDKAYIANEVAYHKTVNGALQNTLIPSATNAELKDLLTTGLKIFQGHEQHAEHVAAEFK